MRIMNIILNIGLRQVDTKKPPPPTHPSVFKWYYCWRSVHVNQTSIHSNFTSAFITLPFLLLCLLCYSSCLIVMGKTNPFPVLVAQWHH